MLEDRAAEPRDRELVVTEYCYEDRPVRVMVLDAEPWFVCNDICRELRLNLLPGLSRVEPEDSMEIDRRYLAVGRTALRTNGRDALWFVSEQGVYDMTIDSRVPELATEFRRWVTRTVLPEIRAAVHPPVSHGDVPVPSKSKPRTRRVKVVDRAARLRALPHSLYRFYGADEALLYIGISCTLASRIGAHQKMQAWWHEVRTIRVEPHPDRPAALAAEAAAIQAEHPQHNVHHQH